MPVVRYITTGQFGNRGLTAFTPAPPRTTSNFSIKMAQHQTPVHQPGTQGVPAPRDAVSGDDAAPTLSGTTGSQFMPPAWYPTLGYAIQRIWDGNFGGVRVFSDNLMPVPARDPRTLQIPAGAVGPVAQPGRNTRPARPNRRVGGLGSRQVIWPARGIRWRGVNSGA